MDNASLKFALTRTRNKVHLVVPSSKANKSEFINEIESIIKEDAEQ